MLLSKILIFSTILPSSFSFVGNYNNKLTSTDREKITVKSANYDTFDGYKENYLKFSLPQNYKEFAQENSAIFRSLDQISIKGISPNLFEEECEGFFDIKSLVDNIVNNLKIDGLKLNTRLRARLVGGSRIEIYSDDDYPIYSANEFQSRRFIFSSQAGNFITKKGDTFFTIDPDNWSINISRVYDSLNPEPLPFF